MENEMTWELYGRMKTYVQNLKELSYIEEDRDTRFSFYREIIYCTAKLKSYERLICIQVEGDFEFSNMGLNFDAIRLIYEMERKTVYVKYPAYKKEDGKNKSNKTPTYYQQRYQRYKQDPKKYNKILEDTKRRHKIRLDLIKLDPVKYREYREKINASRRKN